MDEERWGVGRRRHIVRVHLGVLPLIRREAVLEHRVAAVAVTLERGDDGAGQRNPMRGGGVGEREKVEGVTLREIKEIGKESREVDGRRKAGARRCLCLRPTS